MLFINLVLNVVLIPECHVTLSKTTSPHKLLHPIVSRRWEVSQPVFKKTTDRRTILNLQVYIESNQLVSIL